MPQNLGEGKSVLTVSPCGLDQILSTFGDIFQYVLPDHSLDPRWQTEFLSRITLPFPLPLSWDKSRTVTQMTCHKLMAAFSPMYSDAFKSPGCEKKSSPSADASPSAPSAPEPSSLPTHGESQLI